MTSTRNARPFLVSGGAGRPNDKYVSNANRSNDDHDKAVLLRRPSAAVPRGRASGRRTSSIIPSRRKSRRSTRLSEGSTAVGRIPQNNRPGEASAENGANGTISSAVRVPTSLLSELRFQTAGGAASGANAASRRMSTLKAKGAHIGRRESTLKNVLDQHAGVGPQPARPVAERTDIQAERQQRRKRGLNLGYVECDVERKAHNACAPEQVDVLLVQPFCFSTESARSLRIAIRSHLNMGS